MTTNFLTNSTKLLLSSLLFMSMGTAVAAGDNNWWTNTSVVDCTEPTASIQRAVNRPSLFRRQRTILIVGQCDEDVAITRDDVTLSGGGTGAINGEILIDAARRVVIDGLTVRGTVWARRNADVTVQNSTIENNTFGGIDVEQNAFAFIDNNTIHGNLGCGVVARDGGTVRLRDNIVESAQADASICSTIGLFRHASGRLAGGNTVTNTAGGYAIDLAHGSTFRQDQGHDTIVGKVSVFNMTNADFRDVDITGDVGVFTNSVLRLRDQGRVPDNVTVTGNIEISARAAIAEFRDGTRISGTVECLGSGTVGPGPKIGLTLLDSLGGNVATSEGGVAWVFRGIASGNPDFLSGGFHGCN